MQDSLQWVAIYNDDTNLHQIDSDGKKHAYDDIDRKRLSRFVLYQVESTRVVFSAFFDGDGDKLIWRRRVQKNIGGGENIVHIIGKKHQYVALVTPEIVHIYDNFNEKDALLAPPQLLPQEE